MFSSSVTPTNAPESEDSGLSLSFTVLGSDKRISTSSSSTGEQDTDKDSFEEASTRFGGPNANDLMGGGGGASVPDHDFRFVLCSVLMAGVHPSDSVLIVLVPYLDICVMMQSLHYNYVAHPTAPVQERV